MKAAAGIMSDDLAALLAESLERERQLGQSYRKEIQAAWSPRVRQLWESGWKLKRGHEEALARRLAERGEPTAATTTPPLASPSPREILSWAYEQERLLTLRYRDAARLADDLPSRDLFNRFADEQRQFVERVRGTYRDYSTA